MLATLLQQWARARAFFAIGVEKFHVHWAVDAFPAMVHLSLFIFSAGLLVYLFNIHHTVFKMVGCWVAFLTTMYGLITFYANFSAISTGRDPEQSVVGVSARLTLDALDA
jgi:hypothetical protein